MHNCTPGHSCSDWFQALSAVSLSVFLSKTLAKGSGRGRVERQGRRGGGRPQARGVRAEGGRQARGGRGGGSLSGVPCFRHCSL